MVLQKVFEGIRTGAQNRFIAANVQRWNFMAERAAIFRLSANTFLSAKTCFVWRSLATAFTVSFTYNLKTKLNPTELLLCLETELLKTIIAVNGFVDKSMESYVWKQSHWLNYKKKVKSHPMFFRIQGFPDVLIALIFESMSCLLCCMINVLRKKSRRYLHCNAFNTIRSH